VVFSWDSIDHIDLTEADFIEQREWWIKNNINDYFHGNSVAEAVDGNLLISGRHTNSIIKIDRTSGAVLWRLGGTKSDFTFIDDPEGGFSHQHSVHQLPSGNILLYDNGNQNPRQISRVVEYAIDEVTKTARLVWSYSDGRFTYATGSVQRLKNGNTLIGWGLERDRQRATVPRITEVNQAGVVMMQIYFPDYSGLYNVFKS
jgi:outer membrane protein assembly factor BamB